MLQLNHKKILILFSAVFVVALSIFMANKIETLFPMPKLTISKEVSAYNLQAKDPKLLSFGHSRLLSSLLWITTILESDIEHYKGGDNSWMFHRFKTISLLEPLFYKNYLVGGQYLSIVKDDIVGADYIYAKGVEQFPSDFWLNYHGGFNAAFEMGDYTLALNYYNRIYDHPLTQTKYPSLLSIINKLRLENQDLSLSQVYDLFLSSWLNAENGPVKDLLERNLYALKAQRDLDCLNSKSSNCDLLDFYQEPYIKTNSSQWKAGRDWSAFMLNKKPPKREADNNGDNIN